MTVSEFLVVVLKHLLLYCKHLTIRLKKMLKWFFIVPYDMSISALVLIEWLELSFSFNLLFIALHCLSLFLMPAVYPSSPFLCDSLVYEWTGRQTLLSSLSFIILFYLSRERERFMSRFQLCKVLSKALLLRVQVSSSEKSRRHKFWMWRSSMLIILQHYPPAMAPRP